MTNTAAPRVTASTAGNPATDRLSKPRIRRFEVIQALLDFFDRPRYLEVGVSKGTTFHRLEARFKVAVDPRFRFDWQAEQAGRGPRTQYHEVTSDVYFGSIIDPTQEFDVIYLDGLHTFEQTLRDFTNAVAHLAEGGVIVVDDVRPSSYHASLSDPRSYQKLRQYVRDDRRAWMGDVYKLVWFIDTFYPSMSYATVANNHGQAVVWRERRRSVTERTVSEIGPLSFESMVLDHDVLRLRPFGEIVADLDGRIGRAKRGRRRK
ncbi:class I SAM-dependent methyltransferase [Microlunatus sp. Gsoil 973]|uniref:class I SAM-dependent methyltransferase n=1 Tax=Microlunatus sp. Gsoil 973 TaxID=2672569 RepID=UPI0012B4C518|nr:class I SAM-dependent methyltransferase [Microlunatus sp. Gsoil 973]QGN32936.1 class I SAM-dependent methyltransferase [Microlunatus sp. Gsoil 973]